MEEGKLLVEEPTQDPEEPAGSQEEVLSNTLSSEIKLDSSSEQKIEKNENKPSMRNEEDNWKAKTFGWNQGFRT